MFETSVDDVTSALSDAHNMNAVLKKILRQEVKRGSPEEKFFKDFRRVVNGPKPQESIKHFIESHFPSFERYLMVVGGYVYDEPMVNIAAKVIDSCADRFNATYNNTNGEISVKDKVEFTKVAKESIALIEEGLKEESLPVTPFMKSILIHRLFTPEIVEKLKELL